MKKIKLLFVLPALSSGGAERIVCNLIKNLDRNYFKIKIFLFCNRGRLWNLIPDDVDIVFGDRIYKSDKKNGFADINNIEKDSISKVKLFKNLFRATKDVDIVIGSMELMPTYISMLVAKILRKRVIGWVHINIGSVLKNKNKISYFLHKYILIKLFYNHLDKIICVSRGAQDSIKSYLNPINIKKAICIYNPIDIDFIKNKANENVNISFNKPVIIGIGRLVEQKNFKLLIKAHKYLLDKGIKQTLIIIGEGYQKEELKKLISNYKLDDSVKLLGYQKNPYVYLKKADIFVQSSIFEGLPTVIIESLILSTPVIATDCPSGAAEILENGKYGILVKPNDIQDLGKAIEFLLKSPVKYREFKDKSKDAIIRFDSKLVTKEFEKVFINVSK